MPNLVPDAEGQRYNYEVDVKVVFSMVTERGSQASFMTDEQKAEGLAEAMRQTLMQSILASFTDGYTVTATATATPVDAPVEV